jgi:hypothetical protein
MLSQKDNKNTPLPFPLNIFLLNKPAMRLNISAGLIYPSPRPLDIGAEGRSEKLTKDFYGCIRVKKLLCVFGD